MATIKQEIKPRDRVATKPATRGRLGLREVGVHVHPWAGDRLPFRLKRLSQKDQQHEASRAVIEGHRIAGGEYWVTLRVWDTVSRHLGEFVGEARRVVSRVGTADELIEWLESVELLEVERRGARNASPDIA